MFLKTLFVLLLAIILADMFVEYIFACMQN